MKETNQETQGKDFLHGGGEMGKYIRQKDWSNSPLGPPENWPQSLRTTVSLCLGSNFPISIAWGKNRTQIYNDGYWPICGAKHPESMGQDFKECWFSAWPVIGEAFESASNGKTAFLKNQRMFLDRYGYLEETFFTFSFSPIRDESGEVVGLFHPVTEMTQQSLGERRLSILREIGDLAGDIKSVADAYEQIEKTLSKNELDLPFTVIYKVNQKEEKISHFSSSGIEEGQDAFPQEVSFKEQNIDRISELLKTGSVTEQGDLAEMLPNLKAGPYPENPDSMFVLPIQMSGHTLPFAVIVVGVSARRALDDQYRTFYHMLREAIGNVLTSAWAYEEERKRVEELAALDKAKTLFFSNVSHEFRTPLTLMLGPLEDLKGLSLESDISTEVDVIFRNANRLKKLVNTLLDFSRIESGRIQASYSPTDISTFTSELASNFRSAMEKVDLELKIDAPDIDGDVYVDRDMWEKIVLNIMSNAFKFTFEGYIAVSVKDKDDHVQIDFEDTGEGIPEKDLPSIFDRFKRVEGAKSRSFEGSGIGLSLVRELIKLHKGEVSVQSKEGKGTTFTITLLKGKEHLPQDHIQQEVDLSSTNIGADAFVNEAEQWIDTPNAIVERLADQKNNPRQHTVLVVDDNQDMRSYIMRLLENTYNVLLASNGAHALEVLDNVIPDLIVTDIMMPEMDGFEFMRKLKEDNQYAAIPVIMLSARAGEEAIIEGREAGADDYLIKPFAAKELLSVLHSHLLRRNIRESNELYFRAITDNTPVMTFMTNHQGDCTYLNKQWRDYTGQTIKEGLGKGWLNALVENDQENSFQIFQNALKKEEPFELECRIKKNNKTNEWHLATGLPDFNDGKFNGFIGSVVNIDDRKRAEDKVKESEKKFRTLAENIPILCWIANPEGEAKWFNSSWYTYTNTSLEVVEDWGWTKLINPDMLDEVINKWKDALKQSEMFELIFPLRSEDGKYRSFICRVVPIMDDDGRVIQWFGTHTDITERENLVKQKDEFIGIASHELKTPITTLKAYTQLIGQHFQDSNDPEQLFMVDKMIRQVDKLSDLISDLLDISRIENGKMKFRMETFDFDQMVKGVVEDLQVTSTQHRLEIISKSNAQVYGDRDRLAQVVTNFLTNAIKYSPQANRVLISASTANNKLHFTVEDFGIGLLKFDRDKVFDRFYRADEIDNKTYPGIGLGLFISSKIIERHQGKIGVESQLDVGSRFFFQIPVGEG
ncbi:response regulator [Fulvivirga sp. RKSG066]|uniref:ATP-binding protein n=1 Tax=Fulvivirga aurantia TaxID=2529383 RepID=UPI0012BBC24B|nr:ATP-binding protein [Fulvivirga aurantia]MTI22918.1 response regulator [Fulvivirga aurantia]